MPKQKLKILKWECIDEDFGEPTWKAEDFVIYLYEGLYHFQNGGVPIASFENLSSAQKVAQLIHNG